MNGRVDRPFFSAIDDASCRPGMDGRDRISFQHQLHDREYRLPSSSVGALGRPPGSEVPSAALQYEDDDESAQESSWDGSIAKVIEVRNKNEGRLKAPSKKVQSRDDAHRWHPGEGHLCSQGWGVPGGAGGASCLGMFAVREPCGAGSVQRERADMRRRGGAQRAPMEPGMKLRVADDGHAPPLRL